MIKLDIISDPVCPWCYIGKTLLDQALKDIPDHPFTIEWHPYQLNPEMPPEGVDRQEYLDKKFGGRRQAEEVYGRIQKASNKVGLNIDYNTIKRTPNTLNAHRLIHWAGIEGRQTAAVSRLFKAYFEDGQDIGDIDTLVALAEEIGMDGSATRRLLEGDADLEMIEERDRHARDRGVTGVPTYVVANQHVLVGAQPTDLWLKAIEDIKAALAAE